jgi:hypothetical protein
MSYVYKKELVGKYIVVKDVDNTGLYRILSLINLGNQLHNHESKKPFLHIK